MSKRNRLKRALRRRLSMSRVHTKPKRGQRSPDYDPAFFESLEGRVLLSTTLVGVPDWAVQGPGPILGGQIENIPGNNPVSGAIHTVVAHPTDADTLYLGGTNSGIWRTTNATSGSPNWTPLIDQFPSLSIGALELDPTDASNQTLVAGIGRYSSLNRTGGPRNGLLVTTDGGDTWSQVGTVGLAGRNVSGVGPRGNTILVSVNAGTNPGVYRSIDGGASFQDITGLNGLGNGAAFDLVGDPGNQNRFYAGTTAGIFRTDDLGANWTNVTDAAIGAAIVIGGAGATNNIELAVHNNAGAGTNAVYVGIINAGQLAGFFRSADQGANWTAMDIPQTNEGGVPFGLQPRFKPGGQGGIHFSILADPNDANVVYVGGDRQVPNVGPDMIPGTNDDFFPNSVGANTSSGRLFRGDASIAPTGAVPSPQWTPLTHNGTASNSSPHADSREMVFDANGNIVEVDDGGIYLRTSPTDATGDWFSLNGDYQGTEFHSAAYDTNSDIIFGGTQDNGTPTQPNPGDITWSLTLGGDGGIVQVDTTTVPGASIRYIGTQNLGNFRWQAFDAANNPIGGATGIGLVVNGTGGMTLPNLVNNGIQFYQPYELNAVIPTQMLIGTNALFESTDQGNNLNSLGGINNLNANGLDDDGDTMIDEGDEFSPAGQVGTVTAMAYGGRRNGADVPDVAYVGTNGGTINGVAGNLFLRTANTTNTLADFATVGAYTAVGGSTPQDIVLDPEDWQTAYVADVNDRVFVTTDGGMAWNEITGNLANNTLRTIQFIGGTSSDAILVGGDDGVYRMRTSAPGMWSEFGAGLPNAPVREIRYDAADDVLLAGTQGRGAWTIFDASDTVFTKGVLVIEGDDDFLGQDDLIRLELDQNNPSLLNVFVNSVTPTDTFQLGNVEQINVFGYSGNDTLVVDSSNGLVDISMGIRFDGGGGIQDSLILDQTDGDTHDNETLLVGATAGSGRSILVGPSGTQTIDFENLEPIFTAPPVDDFEITGMPGLASLLQTNNAINYTPSFTDPANGLVTVDHFEPIEFVNKTNVIIDAGAGSDEIHLNNPNTPTGLLSLTVRGGDPTVNDTLIVNGMVSTVAVNTSLSVITGANGPVGGGPSAVFYQDIEDLVVVAGASSELAVSGSSDVTVNPGLAADEGLIITDSIPIRFEGYGSGDTIELTVFGDLTINGTDTVDLFTVAGTTGDVTIDGRATIEGALAAPDLILNGLDGDDVFDVTGPQPYASVMIAGGDPSASDFVQLTGDGSTIFASVGDLNPTVTGGGLGTVNLTGVEVVELDPSGGDLTVEATSSDDTMVVTPTGLNSGILAANAMAPFVLFTDVDSLLVDLLGGDDGLIVNGSAAAEMIAISGAAVAISGKETVNYTSAEALTVKGHAGSDTFDVTPALIPIFVDGGDPIGTTPGDQLNIMAGGDPVTFNPGPQNDEGSFDVGVNDSVSFDRMESFTITGGGPVVINGTNGPDAITLIARDDSTHAGADGVEDFTVSVNASPDFLFLDVASVVINALSGSDEVVLRTPAPNNADWDTDVTVEGGAPSASDRLVVETPGDGAETVLYTPANADSGMLEIIETLAANSTQITLTEIEELVYDGEADDDNLTAVGTAGDDRVLHLAGISDDAGSLHVNNFLPIEYQNLGLDGGLGVDGQGGVDELVYPGTDADDKFVIDSTLTGGRVDFNTHLSLATENVETLTLEGFNGNDAFTLVPAIQASPFATINVNGGDQASTIGDVLSLVGSAGDDAIDLSGQTVTAGGVVINGGGLEDIQIDTLGGIDELTYNGQVGVRDDIHVIAARTAGSGQIEIDDVALYTFNNVERIDAHGNLPAGDTDTLKFSGTNSVDVFDIDLNAQGTVADPILELSDSLGTLMLTLFNYTGFEVLSVDGIQGADVFNIFTGPDQGRELAINGGLPAGKRRRRPADDTDTLNLFYQHDPPQIRANVTHNAETQNQNSGLIQVDYVDGPTSKVEYDNMERIFIEMI